MRRLLPTLVLALATAGCGLTVPLNEHLAAGSAGDASTGEQPVSMGATGATGPATADGAPVDGTGGGGDGGVLSGGGGATATAAPGSAGAPSASSTTAAVGSSHATGTSTATRPAGVATAKASAGATTSAKAAPATPIKVAYYYQSGISGGASALGIKGLSTGDTQAQVTALAADLNSHGGINGRQISLLPLTSSATDSATLQQQLCAAATQDNHANVFISFVVGWQQLAACLKQAGVTFIDDEAGFGQGTANMLGSSYFGPADMTIDRLVKNEVTSLAASGWMTKSNKIGIFAYNDDDATAAINNTMKPALAALGIPVATVQQIASTNAEAGAATVELNFRTAGVDRVLEVDASPLFVMESAASQGYTPKFAVLSGEGPGALLEANAPKSELEGSAGPGYLPYFDIGAGTRPTNWTSNVARCSSILTAAGQGSTDASTLGFESQMCDAFFFLADAGKAGGGVTPAELGAGAAKLGNWPTVLSFSGSFPNGRSDGASSYRYLQFTDSCSCYQYTSGLQPFS